MIVCGIGETTLVEMVCMIGGIGESVIDGNIRSLGFSLVRPQTFPGKGRADDGARETYKKTR